MTPAIGGLFHGIWATRRFAAPPPLDFRWTLAANRNVVTAAAGWTFHFFSCVLKIVVGGWCIVPHRSSCIRAEEAS